MTTEPVLYEQSVGEQLGGIATRLVDIAGCVASEAEMATVAVRSMTAHADRIAALVARLEAAASAMEEGVRQQADALAHARINLVTNKPIIDALEQSVTGVGAISTAIESIAQESRMLSLNARIEAARAGHDGHAFAVVAAEMSNLATRTVQATKDINDRSSRLARDVSAANHVAAAHSELVHEQQELLAASLAGATQQRDAAGELATITAETIGTMNDAAAAIGRVGANAVAVRVLARQLTRLSR